MKQETRTGNKKQQAIARNKKTGNKSKKQETTRIKI